MSIENATKSVSLISRFSHRLFLNTALTMIIAALLSLIVTVVYFNAGLRPYLVDKARAVAESVWAAFNAAIKAAPNSGTISTIASYIPPSAHK